MTKFTFYGPAMKSLNKALAREATLALLVMFFLVHFASIRLFSHLFGRMGGVWSWKCEERVNVIESSFCPEISVHFG